MAGSASSSKKMYLIHSFIYFVIMFGFEFLPQINGITELGMKVLGIFFGVLYGWIFIGFIWPSLFAMLALGMTGYASILEVFQAGMGDATVLKVFYIFIFAGILQATDLTTFIANWCVSLKISRGKPWVLITVIFLAAIIIGGFINQYAAIVIIWYIFYGICKASGLEKGDPLVSYVVVGVPVMSTMGAMMLPFLPVSVIFRSMLQETILTTYEMPTGAMTISHLVLAFTLVVGYLIVGKYILRINTDALKNLSDDFFKKVEGQKMTKEQKFSMITLIGFVLILVLPIIMPDCALKLVLKNLDLVGASVLMICFFMFQKDENGKDKFDFGKMVYQGINWDIIVLFMSTMPISAAMESEETGIVKTLVTAVMPVFEKISPSMYLLACFIVFLLLTQVAHNLILGIVFTSVLASIGIDMGINPYLFQIFFAWSLQLAFMTPGASANSALIFANTNWIDTKSAYKYTAVIILTGGVIACALLPLLMQLY